MTKVLNFTSVAAAPVSERLACGLLDSHCENGLAISRTINKEIAQFRADQHVKIKVGSLLAITADHEFRAHQLSQAMNDYDNMNRAKQQADEALLELVKAEVSSREKAFYNNGYLAGKIAASKPKSHDTWSIKTDGPAVMNGTVKVGGVAARAGAMIENAVVMSGSVKASKVTFSDEMKAAIREVVQAVMDEALKQSIQNEIKKLLK